MPSNRSIFISAAVAICFLATSCSDSDESGEKSFDNSEAAAAPTIFSMTLLEDPLFCDGEEKPVARILAQPGEELAFGPVDLGILGGTADDTGEYILNYSCPKDETDHKVQISIDGNLTDRQAKFTVEFDGVAVIQPQPETTIAEEIEEDAETTDTN